MSSYMDCARKKGAAILGLGVSGKALLRYLLAEGISPILFGREAGTFAFRRENGTEHTYPIRQDSTPLPEVGILFRSPGIPECHPLVAEAHARGIPVTTELGLFLSLCKGSVYAVTGSDGKTTTAHLAHALLGEEAFLGGNIGVSLLDSLAQIRAGNAVVLEISSFQLLDAPQDVRLTSAALLNITENHLDFHGTMADYIRAKYRILKMTSAPVLSLDDKTVREIAETTTRARLFSLHPPRRLPPSPSAVYYTKAGALWRDTETKSDKLADFSDFSLGGEHNLRNLLAAVALTDGACPASARAHVIRTARPVPHRMTPLGSHRGVSFVESSIDSTPSRTATTLAAMPQNTRILLLLGGAGKGLDYTLLLSHLSRVAHIFTFGKEGDAIADALARGACPAELSRTASLEDAFRAACRAAKKGDTVLLSPACTSYDAYPDYRARGAHFAALVASLGNE